MKIFLSPKAEKQIKKLTKIDQIIIARKIRQLINPPQNLNREKISNYKDIFRVRVGDYRIVYRETKNEIYIILIGHRKNIYSLLDQLLK